MIIIVCGSREWTLRAPIEAALEKAWGRYPTLHLIEGGARGADQIAHNWALPRLTPVGHHVHMPAEWDVHHPGWCPTWCGPERDYCSGAGPRRNQAMLDLLLAQRTVGQPTKVLGFKTNLRDRGTGGGTEDMIYRSVDAGVETWTHDGENWHRHGQPTLF